MVQYTHRQTERGKPTAHDGKIPQGKKKPTHSTLSASRYKSHEEQSDDICAHTQTQVHHSSSKTPARHSCESHLCHVYVRVSSTDSRVQYVWLTGCERSTGAEPYLVATMPSQGPEQETLERGGHGQGMLNISWVGRHSAW